MEAHTAATIEPAEKAPAAVEEAPQQEALKEETAAAAAPEQAAPAEPTPTEPTPKAAEAEAPKEEEGVPKEPEADEKSKRAFTFFDTDKSGDIDVKELRPALTKLGLGVNDSAQTQEWLGRYDKGGEGKLGLADFNDLMQHASKQAQAPPKAGDLHDQAAARGAAAAGVGGDRAEKNKARLAQLQQQQKLQKEARLREAEEKAKAVELSESEDPALASRAAKNAAAAAAAGAPAGAAGGGAGNKKDDNPLCGSWATSGECIRNPQYMWAVCSAACGSLSYVDNDPSCSGWAEQGECEKNPEFMLVTCNASCVRSVKRGGAERGGMHANPNQLRGDSGGVTRDGPEQRHRALTFLPIFLAIALLLGAVSALQSFYSSSLSAQKEAAEDAWARRIVVLQRQMPWLAPMLGALGVTSLARVMICVYYLNEGFSVMQTNPLLASVLSATHLFNGDGVWQEHVAWVDAANLAGAAAAGLAALNVQMLPCMFVMLADTLVDSYLLVMRIAWQWLFGRGLYINELMAKKFSLLGCVAMLIAVTVEGRQKKSSFGILLNEATGLSSKTSVALLLSRLLIAVLFLFVGLSELHRLLFQPFTPYLPGDGHDVVWPKAVELLLAIPFTLGFQTTLVSRLLAVSLVLEAFYAWSWWTTPGDSFSFAHHRRAIHYREHFVTNIATAGGLLLLQKIGGGKYTVDELLKKKD